jgi:hypothetical protein
VSRTLCKTTTVTVTATAIATDRWLPGIFLGKGGGGCVNGGLRVRLTTTSPSVSRLSRKYWFFDVSQFIIAVLSETYNPRIYGSIIPFIRAIQLATFRISCGMSIACLRAAKASLDSPIYVLTFHHFRNDESFQRELLGFWTLSIVWYSDNCSIRTQLFCLSFRSVYALSYFHYIFSCYLPSTEPGLGICIAVVMLTWSDPVIEVSSLENGNRSSFLNILFSGF